MKKATSNFLSKLIASMPIEAIRKTADLETKRSRVKKISNRENHEDALNRIFMVRYRIQHL
jgi:hypothetical protein